MNCRLTTPLLNALIDGELTAPQEQRVNDHLAECTSCSQQLSDIQALQTALGSESFYYFAPPALHESVQRAMAASHPVSFLYRPITAASVAAVVVGVLMLAGILDVAWKYFSYQPTMSVADYTIRTHQEAVAQARLTEITSTNPSVLTSWLEEQGMNGVNIWDLTSQGYALKGVRLEPPETRAVPVIVYSNGEQTINVYHWLNSSMTKMPRFIHSGDGLLLMNWNNSGKSYWVVSDLPAGSLEEFVRLFQNQELAAK